MPLNDDIAKRNARILSICQAMSGMCAMTVITTGGLLGQSFADNKALATLPVAFFNLGAWISSYPAAQFMQKYGRARGFILGAAIGLIGAMIVFYGILTRDFIILSIGTTCIGSFQGFSHYYRFAAADMATETYKPKAISFVLFGGIAAALIGGPMINNTKMLYDGVLFAGCFLVLMFATMIVMVLVTFLRIEKPTQAETVEVTRSRKEIFSDPQLLVGIFCGTLTYSLMSLVMTASPLAMFACEHPVDDATTVIQWHVLGMFAPSLFTGILIARFGVRTIMIIGYLLLLLSATTALFGISYWHFWIALFLLGLGWNFGFIGATNMVAVASRPEERGVVQGTNDMLVLGSVTLASFMSGQLLDSIGWNFINYLVFPLCFMAILSLLWLGRRTAHAINKAN